MGLSLTKILAMIQDLDLFADEISQFRSGFIGPSSRGSVLDQEFESDEFLQKPIRSGLTPA